MKRAAKFSLSIGLVFVALLVLTGCRSYSRAEARAIPYSVIEVAQPGWSDYHYSYVDTQGKLHKLDKCARPSFLAQMECTTSDHFIVFAFSRVKSLTTTASVTVDGSKRAMACNVDTDDTWSGLDVCVPEETKG